MAVFRCDVDDLNYRSPKLKNGEGHSYLNLMDISGYFTPQFPGWHWEIFFFTSGVKILHLGKSNIILPSFFLHSGAPNYPDRHFVLSWRRK